MSKAEKTKQFIIEKTAPIFNRKGYAGTSINDLTEATGLTKGGIYGNFSNKDEVALAAFDYNTACLGDIIRKKMQAKAHPVDKLKVYLSVYADIVKNPSLQYGCPILNTAIESDDTHEQLRKRAANAVDRWYKHIEAIIKDGRTAGQIAEGQDATEFAGGFIALIEGGIMITKVTGKPDGLRAALKQAEKMIASITP